MAAFLSTRAKENDILHGMSFFAKILTNFEQSVIINSVVGFDSPTPQIFLFTFGG